MMPDYVLGNSIAELGRLQRQAVRFERVTERLFCEAGIGPGQRVMDLGAGVGDVSLLLARLVGPSGEIVGVERDPQTIAYARERATVANASNVRFIECGVEDIPEPGPFDAVVGRFILHHLPDPLTVIRSVVGLVRPGGVVAFQEPWPSPVQALLEPLPLWSAVASVIRQTITGGGANPEASLALFDMFQDAGLSDPKIWQEITMGRNPEDASWYVDTLRSLLPRTTALNLPLDELGDLATLADRLEIEAKQAKRVTAVMVDPVSIWARKR
jgi:ubiquinone/menaquinone biosynthesis C-methylase UbiE